MTAAHDDGGGETQEEPLAPETGDGGRKRERETGEGDDGERENARQGRREDRENRCSWHPKATSVNTKQSSSAGSLWGNREAVDGGDGRGMVWAHL
ncbi:hypothetical protein DPEC_G00233950 [Dallia pectoralis]|uniref:Uncharacterized protein n=1 Tax=Dallia pectoralis TaxID=75939 RepID=A0ACC2FXY3_DALPE|nr:hypothetical protein DPEC_G00233950 [Dallia pectoralis]